MERYAKKEIDLWDLVSIYEWEFDSTVKEPFPKSKFCPNMRELYFTQGKEFLKSFPGYEDIKILEVESAFEKEIDDWLFNGIIDLVYEDKDGNLVIQDYKSKSKFKSKKEQAEYARQLYLYSLYIKDKYGRYPQKLKFLMFRHNTPVEIDFSEKDFNEAILWAKNTVKEIRTCWNYPPQLDDFYCSNLCNHREQCEFKEEYDKKH